MTQPAERLPLRTRARKVAVRGVAQVRAAGVGPGWRRYRPERWSVGRWDHAYGAGEFDYMASLGERPRYAMLLSYLELAGPAPSVLDIGCGPGILRRTLRSGAFSSYVGIDLSAAAIEAARRQSSDDRTDFRVGDAMAVDLPATDVVVLNEMLYYAPVPQALIRRVAAVVRPDGLILASIWRHAGDRALWRMLDEELDFVAAARVRAEANPFNRLGWRVSCHGFGTIASRPHRPGIARSSRRTGATHAETNHRTGSKRPRR